MGSFVKRPGIMAGVALAGAALTLTAPAAAAQAKAAVPGVINVPCGASALKTAVIAANGGGAAVLALSSNCTYSDRHPRHGDRRPAAHQRGTSRWWAGGTP